MRRTNLDAHRAKPRRASPARSAGKPLTPSASPGEYPPQGVESLGSDNAVGGLRLDESMTQHEPRRPTPIKIFVSYAPGDEALRCELSRHLADLDRCGAINTWSAQSLHPGEEWDLVTQARLNAADLILLLVTSDYLASDSCMEKETARALARARAEGVVVIPILARPCDWAPSSFAHLSALPTGSLAVTAWSNRDQAWESVARDIRSVVEGLQEGSANGTDVPVSRVSSSINPFEFGSTVPADRFAGRRAQRADVRSRFGGIAAQSLSLVGLQRSGKSSLFRYVAEKTKEFCAPEQNPLVVSLDLGSKLFHTPEGILEGLRHAVERQTGTSPWKKEQSQDGFAVNDGLELLRDQRVRLVVLLDDFERISARLDRFQDWGEDWRSKASAGYFALGIATRRPLVEVYSHCGLTSPFGNIFSTTRLGALLHEEWTALVRNRFSQHGGHVTDRDLTFIDELSGGLPFYVQMAASLLWQHRAHEKTRTEFRLQSADRFRELWHSLTAPEQHALRYGSGTPGRAAPAPAVVEDMIRYGVLRADGGVFSSIFADVVRAQP